MPTIQQEDQITQIHKINNANFQQKLYMKGKKVLFVLYLHKNSCGSWCGN